MNISDETYEESFDKMSVDQVIISEELRYGKPKCNCTHDVINFGCKCGGW